MKIDTFLVKTTPLLRLLASIFLAYYFGIIKGIIITLILHNLYEFTMKLIFNLQPLTSFDKVFLFGIPEEAYYICNSFRFDSLDYEKFKESFYENALKRFERLRSIRKIKFLEFWWEILSFEDAKKKLIFRENSEIIINSKDDLSKFLDKENRVQFDLNERLPYEFLLLNNPKNQFGTHLIMKFEHSLSDGLGIISLICGLADNFDKDSFPKNKPTSFFTSTLSFFISLITLPYYMVISLANVIRCDTGTTPFKLKNYNGTGQCETSISEVYDLRYCLNSAKKLKVTFNDMILSAFSASLNKMIKSDFSKFSHLKSLSFVMTIGDRDIPNKIEDLKILNDTQGKPIIIKLINDPLKKKEVSLITEEASKMVKSPIGVAGHKNVVKFLLNFTPYWLSLPLIRNSAKRFDITISNVPGCTKPLKYSGSELKEYLPVITLGMHSCFIIVLSYCNMLRFTVITDVGLGVKSNVMMKYFEEELKVMLDSLNA